MFVHKNVKKTSQNIPHLKILIKAEVEYLQIYLCGESKASYVRATIFMKKPIQEQLEELIHEIKNQSLKKHKHLR